MDAKSSDKKSGGKKKTGSAKPSPVDVVMDKYASAGWVTMTGGGVVDIIARRDKRYQFIQVIPYDRRDEPAYQGEARNAFVQNAMSNSAEPVHAVVEFTIGRDGTVRSKVKFTNVNFNTTVKIAATKSSKGDAKAE